MPTTSDDETPSGVAGLDLSKEAKRKEVKGKEADNVLVRGVSDIQSPRKKSVLTHKIERDGRGTPIDQLFDYKWPTEETTTPKVEILDRKSFAINEETSEDEFIDSVHSGGDDDWPITVNDILAATEARNDFSSSQLEAESIAELSNALANTQIDRKSSPVTFSRRLVKEEVTVEDVMSSDSDSESDYYVKSPDGKQYIRVKSDTTAKATEIFTEESFDGLMEFTADNDLTNSEVPTDTAPLQKEAQTPPQTKAQALSARIAAQIQAVNLMDYRNIEAIASLGLGDRIYLIGSLHDQIRDSYDFKSQIKLKDLPKAIFFFKISLIVRRFRKTLLTLEEMKSDRKLLKAIYSCKMDLPDLIEVVEELKRAGRDEVSDEIMSEIIIPHVVDLHLRRNAKKEKKESDVCNLFMSMLTVYGRVLVLNDLLNDRCVGKILRQNIGALEVYAFLETILSNGCISDEEAYVSMRLLLKGLKDVTEFKEKYAPLLLELCERFSRKGKLIEVFSA